MKYANKNISDLTLAELQAADWDLAVKENNWNKSIEHSKFEKMSPKPQLGEAFVKLRQEIKDAINSNSKVN